MYFKFNIFSRAVGGRALTHPSFMEEVILMSTYEEFMVILTAGILLVSILEFAIELKRTTLLENQKNRILHYEQAFNFLKQS